MLCSRAQNLSKCLLSHWELFQSRSWARPMYVREGLRTAQYDLTATRHDAITDSVHNASSTYVQHVTTFRICPRVEERANNRQPDTGDNIGRILHRTQAHCD